MSAFHVARCAHLQIEIASSQKRNLLTRGCGVFTFMANDIAEAGTGSNFKKACAAEFYDFVFVRIIAACPAGRGAPAKELSLRSGLPPALCDSQPACGGEVAVGTLAARGIVFFKILEGFRPSSSPLWISTWGWS